LVRRTARKLDRHSFVLSTILGAGNLFKTEPLAAADTRQCSGMKKPATAGWVSVP